MGSGREDHRGVLVLAGLRVKVEQAVRDDASRKGHYDLVGAGLFGLVSQVPGVLFTDGGVTEGDPRPGRSARAYDTTAGTSGSAKEPSLGHVVSGQDLKGGTRQPQMPPR